MGKLRVLGLLVTALGLSTAACRPHGENLHHELHDIVATTPAVMDVDLTQDYVCQIHSQQHIEIQALETGYLEEIPIQEGQRVKKGDVLFKVVPSIYKAKWEAELAELQLAQLELANSKKLFEDKVVSDREVKLFEAKLARAHAQVKLAEAELNFTTIRAPFDGIVDRMLKQTGSLVKEGEVLTTLSDNSTMWVYFNVPEARYLEYMETKETEPENQKVELRLANGRVYPHEGRITAIEADFNNETGNISFRADFPNPDGLLRHGQTGNILLTRRMKNAVVIPQRATFEVLDKRYVFTIDDKSVVHQNEIQILHELDDVFLIEHGLNGMEKIVLDGIRQVVDGQVVEFAFQDPEHQLRNQKYHAE